MTTPDPSRYEPMYEVEINPHNGLTRTNVTGQLGIWQCEKCPAKGTMEEVNAIACTYVYPPCPHCNLTPICAKA